MQMNHILAARTLMKVIYILCDHSQLGYSLGKIRNGSVGLIGLRLDNLMPAPFLPSPAERRVVSVRIAGGKLGRGEVLPKPRQSISEGRNAAFR